MTGVQTCALPISYLECLVREWEADGWRMNYLLWHVLPMAALEMKRKSRLFINSDEFYKIAEKSMKLIKEKEFALAFPEYLGKAGQVMEGINSQAEWADCIISGLNDRLALLSGDRDGSFHIAHEVYLDFLSERAQENLKKYLKRREI